MNDKKPKILIVEDDEGLQRQLKWSFNDYEVLTAGDAENALKIIDSDKPPVITLDLGLPPDPDGTSEGFRLLGEILTRTPKAKVIVASGHGAPESALRAIRMGAYDFYRKPVDADELALIVQRAHQLYALEEENRALQESTQQSPLQGVITASDSMLQVCKMTERIAPTDATVLLLGASGTGKELLARALHELSDRKGGPFVAINCAAIPENLLESELFGYEKGAFTGAVKTTPGKIEVAEKGTLMLDEVGDLPLPLQVKLLRFLQERVVERIGGRKEIPVNVRVVSATHQNLGKLIEDGRFREDLYYRLAEISVEIPPLSEREGDVLLLAKSFLGRFAREQKRNLRGLSPDAMRALSSYDWPGNVRELENKMKRAVIMAEGAMVTSDDLDLPAGDGEKNIFSLKHVREQADRRALRQAIAYAEGNISSAAKLLEISRPTFYDLMRQYDINDIKD